MRAGIWNLCPEWTNYLLNSKYIQLRLCLEVLKNHESRMEDKNSAVKNDDCISQNDLSEYHFSKP